MPLDREEQWRAAAAHDSVLDHRLSITLSTGRWIAVVAAILFAGLLRLPGLDRWAFSAGEGETALAARDLLLGNDVPNDLLGRPFLVEWTALFMFLGDSVDSVARISAAVAGVAVVVLTLRLGRWIGPTTAAATGILIALSPTMVATSRRIDGGALLVGLTLAVLGCALVARERPSTLWPVLTGVSAALLVLAGPLGLPALLLAVFALYLLSRSTKASTRPAATLIGGTFVATYVLVSTALFTRPAGVWSATSGMLDQLFTTHLANAGDRFHVPLFNLIINEPILIVLALVALVAAPQRTLVRAVGLWTLAALVIVSLLGDTGIAGHGLIILPLALLAGVGGAYLVERIPWSLLRRGPATLYVLALLVLFFAVTSLIGLVSADGGIDGAAWIFRFLLISLVVVLPLAVGLSYLGPRLSGYRLVLLLTTALLVLSALTVRSSVLAASERPGEPMDPLAEGSIAPSVPAVIERVERISRDLTRNNDSSQNPSIIYRTPQDPTGGHGLRIAIDEALSQPLLWYFRDYPNVTVFEPGVDTLAGDVQVAFVQGDTITDETAPGLVGRPYLFSYDSPGIYDSPNWADLIGGVVSISDWRSFWGFLIDRTAPAPEDERMFQLMVIPAIGERLFGPTGPYSLADEAGAGTEGGQFNAPRGIDVADDGTTYVVDAGNHRVQVFDPFGDFVRAFGRQGAEPGQFASFPGGGQGGPGGIAVDGDRVYVADTWNHRIQVFSLDGEYITGWGSFFDAQDDPDATASNPGLFYGPRGVAVHDDQVYVTDTGNERVQVFNRDGEFVTMFGSPGSAEGQLLEPVGIAVTADAVFVADSHNARVARFSHDGEPLEAWDVPEWDGLTFFEPYLTVGADSRLFVTVSTNAQVISFDADGQRDDPLTDSDMLRPYGIAAGQDTNTVLVTDGIRNAVVQLDVVPR